MGYLFRVGQSRTRPHKFVPATRLWEPVAADGRERLFEPALPGAIAELSEQQRVAVVLVHGYGWTLREVADVLDVTASTVQTHVERALAKLRASLEVNHDA